MSLCKASPWFIVLCMSGGRILARHSGYSFLAGAVGGVVVGMLPLLILSAIVGLMLVWCPERPICICGKCHSEDYDYVGPMYKPEDIRFTLSVFFVVVSIVLKIQNSI